MSLSSPTRRSHRQMQGDSLTESDTGAETQQTHSPVAVQPTHHPRFHDLDSLRAAMMLLGIVFHAAWFFIPVYYGHTLSDVSGSWGFSYFFGWVHQFRMQTFFLIAGFFACLLIQKRGTWSFAKNRMLRIVFPFLLGMLTLWPLMKLQYLRGGLISGRILSDEPLMTQYWNIMTNINWKAEWLIHLWFLYTLILLYLISWSLTLLFDLVVDRSNRVRPRIIRLINVITESRLGPFLLAIPVAVCMAIDLTWFGIFSGDLVPLWTGVFAYWIFFAVGWCLYARPMIIDTYVKRWPSYLLIGSVMSLILCGYYHTLLLSGRQSWGYPALTDTEINYPGLREQLLSAAQNPEKTEAGVVWSLLDPTYQNFLIQKDQPTSDQISGLALGLSLATVFNQDFDAALKRGKSGGQPSTPAGERVAAASSSIDAVRNRELLSDIFGSDVTMFWTPPMWIRATYFYVYCLASWLMVFAMLGMFRQVMSHPSPTARYLADSSYWLFLIHLPIQFELSLYIAQWEFNGILKFLLYNLITFAIAIPSYHFLVRSTWLGLLLNGRLYPLKKKVADVEPFNRTHSAASS